MIYTPSHMWRRIKPRVERVLKEADNPRLRYHAEQALRLGDRLGELGVRIVEARRTSRVRAVKILGEANRLWTDLSPDERHQVSQILALRWTNPEDILTTDKHPAFRKPFSERARRAAYEFWRAYMELASEGLLPPQVREKLLDEGKFPAPPKTSIWNAQLPSGRRVTVPVVNMGHLTRVRARLRRRGVKMERAPIGHGDQLWPWKETAGGRDTALMSMDISPGEALMRWVEYKSALDAQAATSPASKLAQHLAELSVETGEGVFQDAADAIAAEVRRQHLDINTGMITRFWSDVMRHDWGALEPIKAYLLSYIKPWEIERAAYTGLVALTLGLPVSWVKDITGTLLLQALPGNTSNFLRGLYGMGMRGSIRLADVLGISGIYYSHHIQMAELPEDLGARPPTAHPLSDARKSLEDAARLATDALLWGTRTADRVGAWAATVAYTMDYIDRGFKPALMVWIHDDVPRENVRIAMSVAKAQAMAKLIARLDEIEAKLEGALRRSGTEDEQMMAYEEAAERAAEAFTEYKEALRDALRSVWVTSHLRPEKSGIRPPDDRVIDAANLTPDEIKRLMTEPVNGGRWYPVGGELEAAVHRHVQWRIFFSVPFNRVPLFSEYAGIGRWVLTFRNWMWNFIRYSTYVWMAPVKRVAGVARGRELDKKELARDIKTLAEFNAYALVMGGIRGAASTSLIGIALWMAGARKEESEQRRKERLRRMLGKEPGMLEVLQGIATYGALQPAWLLGQALHFLGLTDETVDVSSSMWSIGPFDLPTSEDPGGLKVPAMILLRSTADLGFVSSFILPAAVDLVGLVRGQETSDREILGRRVRLPRVIQRALWGYSKTSTGRRWFEWSFQYSSERRGVSAGEGVLARGYGVADRIALIALLLQERAKLMEGDIPVAAQRAKEEVQHLEQLILDLANLREVRYEDVEKYIQRSAEQWPGHLGFAPYSLMDALHVYFAIKVNQRREFGAAAAATQDVDRLLRAGLISIRDGEPWVSESVVKMMALQAYNRWVADSAAISGISEFLEREKTPFTEELAASQILRLTYPGERSDAESLGLEEVYGPLRQPPVLREFYRYYRIYSSVLGKQLKKRRAEILEKLRE